MTGTSEEEAKLSDLNSDQRQRLVDFARQHGSGWRETLNQMWWVGKDANQRDDHLLRQIRNQFGPCWLANLKEL